jgi:hypothetical protein
MITIARAFIQTAPFQALLSVLARLRDGRIGEKSRPIVDIGTGGRAF